jgi:hypothetical protein
MSMVLSGLVLVPAHTARHSGVGRMKRVLALLEIDCGRATCGECHYLNLNIDEGPHCMLFTGSLEEGSRGPMRAEECRDAERHAWDSYAQSTESPEPTPTEQG